jgi:predicted DNA-binding transcriptional regulator AlpA
MKKTVYTHDGLLLLSLKQVRDYCGNTTAMSVWRYRKDKDFPSPHTCIGTLNYWLVHEIRDWWDKKNGL